MQTAGDAGRIAARHPTASAARPRRSGTRCPRSQRRGRAARGPDGHRSSRRRRHRTRFARARAAAISSSDGFMPDDDLVDRREVHPQRATETRLDGGRRVGGRQVRRSRHDREDRRVAAQRRVTRRPASATARQARGRERGVPTTRRGRDPAAGPPRRANARREAIRSADSARAARSNRPRAAAASSVASTRRRDRG